MAQLSAFNSRILPRVVGCPEPTVEQAVLDACIRFCEESHILRKRLDPVTAVANNNVVELDLPAQTRLVSVKRVWVDGRQISPKHLEDSDATDNTLTNVSTGFPRNFIEADGALELYPVPDKSYTVAVYAALKPSRTATAVDDVLFEDWVDGIVAGALAKLQTEAQPWANPIDAAKNEGAYIRARNAALLESSSGRTPAEQQVRAVHI